MTRAAILLAASACVLTAACGSGPQPPPPPIKASAMDKLLPSVEKVSDITGATLEEVKTLTELPDSPPSVSDPRCQDVTQVAGKHAYANSGSTAVRLQLLHNMMAAMLKQQGSVTVDQAVVLFPGTQQAQAFFTAASKSWPACANKQVTVSVPTMKEFHVPTQMSMSVGQVSDSDHTLTAHVSSSAVVQGTTVDSHCQHLLTVDNNVVIDVSACSGKVAANAPAPPPQAADAAVTIVHEIAVTVDNYEED
jgi:PknH-like extracellular domain